MYCNGAISYGKEEQKSFQKEENAAYRSIFKAANYTPKIALRGEIGSSCMTSRDMKNNLFYVWHFKNKSSNKLLKECFAHQF